MNLNKQLELADAIFGRDPQTGLERVTATAVSDSADGSVTVEFDDGTTAEVPVTGAVKLGDEVIVNVQNGTPVAAGSAGWGDRVQTIAEDAQAVAEATGQHFWHRDTNPDGAGAGAFITDTEQDDFFDAAADGFSDYDPDAKPYANMLLNSFGVLIRNALHTFASFTKSAVSFFDGSGNVTASFGSSGAVVGMVADGESRTEVATSGLHIYQRVSGNDVSIADLGYGLGNDGGGGTANAPYYSLGTRLGQIGNWSVAEGYQSTASHYASHAEGYATDAAGFASHAEGEHSLASGKYAHAEGYYTKATNNECHAEGSFSEANGMFSHAQNCYTLANGRYQTAIGKYNIADTDPVGEYALIIGNGTADNARSNAFTVAWNGDIVASGEVTDGNNNTLSGKQDTLVSGTNIKTVNNESLLGSGNITIQGGGGDITTWYGTSTTAASTQTKDVTCADFVLTEGALIVVYFSNKNTYGSLKLNVNSTGALNVYHRGAVSAASNFVTWDAKAYVLFQYNGTGWVFLTASDGRIISSKDRQNSANVGIWGTGGVDHLICKASTMTTGTPSTDGHIIDLDWDASYPQHAQLFLPCVQGYYPQWRMQTGNTTWTPWDTLYTYSNPPTGLGAFKFARYIPTSAAAQSLTTSVSAVNAVSVLDAGDSALVTNPATGVYEFAEAGTYRIKAQLGMYPNTTARTRLCVGLYDTSTSGTRLAMGVHMVTSMTANSASMVTTVACEYIGAFAAGDRIALGAFADVTAAKVTKSSSGDLTYITFEKLA